MEISTPSGGYGDSKSRWFGFYRKSKKTALKSELAAVQHNLAATLQCTSHENGKLQDKIEDSSRTISVLEKKLQTVSSDIENKNRKVHELLSYVGVVRDEDAVVQVLEEKCEETSDLQRLSSVVKKLVMEWKENSRDLHQLKNDISLDKQYAIKLADKNSNLQTKLENLILHKIGLEEKIFALEKMCNNLTKERNSQKDTFQEKNLELEDLKREFSESKVNHIDQETELFILNEQLENELKNATNVNRIAMFETRKLKRERTKIFNVMHTGYEAYEDKLRLAWRMFCKIKKEKEALPQKIYVVKPIPRYKTESSDTGRSISLNLTKENGEMKTKVMALEQRLFRRDKLIAELEDRIKFHEGSFSIFSDKYLSSFLDETFHYTWSCSNVTHETSSISTLNSDISVEISQSPSCQAYTRSICYPEQALDECPESFHYLSSTEYRHNDSTAEATPMACHNSNRYQHALNYDEATASTSQKESSNSLSLEDLI